MRAPTVSTIIIQFKGYVAKQIAFLQKDPDYSQNGACFITICVQDRRELLGKLDVGTIINRPPMTELSEYGIVVDNVIKEIPKHYPFVFNDKYISCQIMFI